LLVVVWQIRTNNTVTIKLQIMSEETPETCWVTHKRQVINLWNCCILLVDLFALNGDVSPKENNSRFLLSVMCLRSYRLKTLLICVLVPGIRHINHETEEHRRTTNKPAWLSQSISTLITIFVVVFLSPWKKYSGYYLNYSIANFLTSFQISDLFTNHHITHRYVIRTDESIVNPLNPELNPIC
jgi:hypothetical protein